jgi:hypothetical protein
MPYISRRIPYIFKMTLDKGLINVGKDRSFQELGLRMSYATLIANYWDQSRKKKNLQNKNKGRLYS